MDMTFTMDTVKLYEYWWDGRRSIPRSSYVSELNKIALVSCKSSIVIWDCCLVLLCRMRLGHALRTPTVHLLPSSYSSNSRNNQSASHCNQKLDF